jgi:hypothetical protein
MSMGASLISRRACTGASIGSSLRPSCGYRWAKICAFIALPWLNRLAVLSNEGTTWAVVAAAAAGDAGASTAGAVPAEASALPGLDGKTWSAVLARAWADKLGF